MIPQNTGVQELEISSRSNALGCYPSFSLTKICLLIPLSLDLFSRPQIIMETKSFMYVSVACYHYSVRNGFHFLLTKFTALSQVTLAKQVNDTPHQKHNYH